MWLRRLLILPVEVHVVRNLGMQGQAGHDPITDNTLVQGWQNTRVPPVDHVGVGVWLVTIFYRRWTIDL